MSEHDLFWWEKSVEFSFWAQAIKEGCYISPLDGWHELAGDAFLNDGKNKWLLIEFKKNRSSIDSEKKKFSASGYEMAKTFLNDQDSFHFLIFAEELKETDNPEIKRKLSYQTYFSDKKQPDITGLLKQSVGKNQFDSYLKEYIYYKEIKDGDSGEAQGPLQLTKSIDYGNIAFVSPDGQLLNMCRLDDYALANELIIFVEPAPTKENMPKHQYKPPKIL